MILACSIYFLLGAHFVLSIKDSSDGENVCSGEVLQYFIPTGWLEVTAISGGAKPYTSEFNSTMCDAQLFEEDLTDPETWWDTQPDYRVLATTVPIYIGDYPSLLAGHRYETIGTLFGRLKGQHCDHLSPNSKNNVDFESFVDERRPFICNSKTGSAYNFTAVGDSHAYIFDILKMRTSNLWSINWAIGATLRGLKNNSSESNAANQFREILGERKGRGDVLIIALGDVDVHGYLHKEYACHQASHPLAVNKSLSGLGRFLDENYKGGEFQKVLLMALPLQTIKAQRHLALGRVNLNVTFEERVHNTFCFNEALRSWCVLRTDCLFVDPNPLLWWNGALCNSSSCLKLPSDAGVRRPYRDILDPDVHLRADRAFGVILEALRESLDAKWCSVSSSGTVQYLSGSGFEPVLMKISMVLNAKHSVLIFMAQRSLNPRELAEQIVHNTSCTVVIRELTPKSDALEVLNLMRTSSVAFESLVLKISEILGPGWGTYEKMQIPSFNKGRTVEHIISEI
jgi:hypothetical protein